MSLPITDIQTLAAHTTDTELSYAAALGTAADALIALIGATMSGNTDAMFSASSALDAAVHAASCLIDTMRDLADDRQAAIRAARPKNASALASWEQVCATVNAERRNAEDIDIAAAAARLEAALRNVIPASVLEQAIAANTTAEGA